METGRDFTIRVRFERDAGVEPNGKSRQRDASRTLRLGSAHSASTSAMRVNRIEFVFLERLVAPAELHRHVVKTAGREAAIEMA